MMEFGVRCASSVEPDFNVSLFSSRPEFSWLPMLERSKLGGLTRKLKEKLSRD